MEIERYNILHNKFRLFKSCKQVPVVVVTRKRKQQNQQQKQQITDNVLEVVAEREAAEQRRVGSSYSCGLAGERAPDISLKTEFFEI